ncbi:dihydrolipoyl dehydrogenase [Halothermothrix orenii]|uniref:Dihydrolipoyl dehydrogenase n=1 Tax=Halothermothrix orenii (strain H 168 / OCM 544 / DSM 9562) TaxID=373903 RepID=B8CZZ6_HALOH|nr:dihydrolipoyl dehydrogenase [Halothermothrix orenii]ACL70848.1 dihydrolipoamide dehydrogenase [Halothermothrix orenii H 168]
MVELTLDGLLNNASEAKVTRVNVEEGEKINKGDLLFEVEANKAAIPVESNYEGKITKIAVKEGDVVKKGDLLATIEETEGEANQKQEDTNPEKAGNAMEADITIIGAGPGGYVAAIKAAQMGAKVVLVEKDKLGGTCLNRGCIPTKALVRSAEIYNYLKEADDFGCHAENISLNMKKVIKRKDKIVSRLVKGIEFLMRKNGVKVIQGSGQIKDPETVYVKKDNGDVVINTSNIIIATGSVPAHLPIEGADLPGVINSAEALELEELPEKMVIVGGGVIGMEFAFIFNSFGVDVTVVEYLDDILASNDSDICSEITSIAENRNIKIFTGSRVEKINETEDGKYIVSFTQNDKNKFVTGDKVLMAVGRKPFFEGIGVEELGLELNEKGRGIKVNDKMQTSIPNIYAIGDVTSKILLAHAASHQGIVAVKNIMGEECKMDYGAIPGAVFTDPEIATVGYNEKTATEAGIEYNVGVFPFKANGKVLTLGENKGFIKILTEKDTDKVIGCSMIGPHSTDLIAEVTLAVKNGLRAEDIAETIHAHPTTAEVIHEAALSAYEKPLHTFQ